MANAIRVLDEGSLRIALVIDDDGRLLGTVTDGDIRRALLQQCTMQTPVSEFMNRSPRTAPANENRTKILTMLRENDFLQIPLLDRDGVVVGLETLQHLTENKKYENSVFLMAGGFGTRLKPLTTSLPKPLLRVGSKPILETILDSFVEAGFSKIFISTHYKSEMVRSYFGNGDRWGISIEYVHETEPLGTAGALGLLPIESVKFPLIMMNGDLLTKINFESLLQFHNENTAIATMCVREYDFQVPYGVVKAEGHKVVGITEKPIQRFFVNGGVYVVNKKFVKSVGKNEAIDMPDLLGRELSHGNQINMYPVHEYWLDIGRLDDLERAKQDFVNDFNE